MPKGRKRLLFGCAPYDLAIVDGTATLYDLLFEQEKAKECVQHMDKLDVIASDKLLKNLGKRFPDDATRLFTIRDACEDIRDSYDFIIIDMPPSLGCMLSNSLTFVDEILIPVTRDRYETDRKGNRFPDLYFTVSG